MDFFGAQERARRLSLWLVVLLIVAVVGMIAAAVAVIALAMVLIDGGQPGGDPLARALDPLLLGGVAFGVLLVVGAGSLARHLQLRSGGSAVAEALGGRVINAATRDPDERRLLNVVEEMAIASGLPVPSTYLLDEPGINAFAAGHTSQDAAIGVTRGAIRCLTRDELQGVIAHEFSHVLHGDMRLNMRLIALLYGILVIGLVGRMLLRGTAARRMTRGSRQNNGQIVLLGAGLALMLVGFVGTVCGNLIKAAVSRQREFLADASAVQYTRNPAGLADALKRVAAHAHGSELHASRAEEFSHLYFSRGLPGLRGLTATHPPLATRIRRLDPAWDGHLPEPSVEREPEPVAAAAAGLEEPADQTRAAAPAAGMAPLLAMSVARRVGEPNDEDLQQARRVLAGIDPILLEAAHDPYAARAVVYGILMGAEPSSRARQREALVDAAVPEVLVELDRLAEPLAAVRPGQRLALIELCLPMLQQLSVAQYARFRDCLERLMAAEDDPGALQWALHRLVISGSEGVVPRRGHRHLAQVEGAVACLLSSLALAGSRDETMAAAAFRQAADTLGLSAAFAPRPAAPGDLDEALNHCRQLAEAERPRLLDAMARCVAHDGRVHPQEAELLRAVAWALDCPLPMSATD